MEERRCIWWGVRAKEVASGWNTKSRSGGDVEKMWLCPEASMAPGLKVSLLTSPSKPCQNQTQSWLAGLLLLLSLILFWNSFWPCLSLLSCLKCPSKVKPFSKRPDWPTSSLCPPTKIVLETLSPTPDPMNTIFSPQILPPTHFLCPNSLFHSSLVGYRILGGKLFPKTPGIYDSLVFWYPLLLRRSLLSV